MTLDGVPTYGAGVRGIPPLLQAWTAARMGERNQGQSRSSASTNRRRLIVRRSLARSGGAIAFLVVLSAAAVTHTVLDRAIGSVAGADGGPGQSCFRAPVEPLDGAAVLVFQLMRQLRGFYRTCTPSDLSRPAPRDALQPLVSQVADSTGALHLEGFGRLIRLRPHALAWLLVVHESSWSLAARRPTSPVATGNGTSGVYEARAVFDIPLT
jgi:hypothetical protein